MLDVAPTELLLVAVVALVVIGPKDLPRAMRFVGQWVARARGVARHFRSGIDEMIRQAELEEMEKKWGAENERIMREHPAQPTMIESAIQAGSDQAGGDQAGGDQGEADGEMVPLGGPPQTMADAYRAAAESGHAHPPASDPAQPDMFGTPSEPHEADAEKPGRTDPLP